MPGCALEHDLLLRGPLAMDRKLEISHYTRGRKQLGDRKSEIYCFATPPPLGFDGVTKQTQ